MSMNEVGRRSRTPSADVERELLAAAEAVLVRDGPSGLTVRAVATEAGIAPMGVYSRLGSKDGLLDALLIRGFDRLRAALGAADEADPLQRLRGCGRRYRQFALANPHFYSIMFEGAIPRDHRSDTVAEHAAAAFGALVRSVELAAAAGQVIAPDATEVLETDSMEPATPAHDGLPGQKADQLYDTYLSITWSATRPSA